MSSHLSPAAQVRHRVPRIAEAAVERARLTVVPRRRTRAARLPFVALVSALLVGGVVGLLLFNTSMQQASFASTALEEQAAALTAREQTLEMDIERLRDPQTLAEKAQQAGYVPAPSGACLLHLDTGKVEGTCTAAKASDDLPIESVPPAKPAELSPDPVIVPANDAGRGNGQGNGRRDGRGSRNDDTARGDGNRGSAAGRTGQQQSRNEQRGNR